MINKKRILLVFIQSFNVVFLYYRIVVVFYVLQPFSFYVLFARLFFCLFGCMIFIILVCLSVTPFLICQQHRFCGQFVLVLIGIWIRRAKYGGGSRSSVFIIVYQFSQDHAFFGTARTGGWIPPPPPLQYFRKLTCRIIFMPLCHH